jgi:ParB-like chromosome segregation protein Spo0J
MSARQLEHRPLAVLKPDPRNPKAHATGVIDDSVGRFGFLEPIVVDERTGYIISGHGRTKTLTAMQERGDTPPEGVQVGEDGEWLAPVVVGWASRSDSEAAAALIALNRTTELGGWVDDELLDLLDGLAEQDDGLLGVGYGDDEIAALRRHIDNVAMADAANGGDFGEDASALSDPMDLDGHLMTCTVIIEKEHRSAFYAVMAELPYVTDTRDSTGA